MRLASCERGDVVLDEHAVFEHGDLDAPELRAHDHHAVDGLAAREELALGDDWPAATGVAAVATALLLGLEPRGALDPLRLGDELRLALAARLAHAHDGVGGVVPGAGLLAGAAAGTATHGAGLIRKLERS